MRTTNKRQLDASIALEENEARGCGMDEALKKEITKEIGTIDAEVLIPKLIALGVKNDVEFYDRGISIPATLVKDIDSFQQELRGLSKVGRTFPLALVEDWIQIDIISLSQSLITSCSTSATEIRNILDMIAEADLLIKETIDLGAASLNAIYFNKDGIINEAIIENLINCSLEARASGFSFFFWTDNKVLNEEIRIKLIAQGVLISDFRECGNLEFASIIEEFVQRGYAGDKCAYAIASDILRVIAAENVRPEDMYIYFDCNDILFDHLRDDLTELKNRFFRNSLGLAFPINILSEDQKTSEILKCEFRNDVFIARKANNPRFMEYFFSTYKSEVLKKFKTYQTPINSVHTKEQADSISSFVTSIPFEMLRIGYIRLKGFEENAYYRKVPLAEYLSTQRNLFAGNGWREYSYDYFLNDSLEIYETAGKKFSNAASNLGYELLLAGGVVPNFVVVYNTILLLGLANNLINSDIKSLRQPETKLITYPRWEEAKKVNLQPQTSTNEFALFQRVVKEAIVGKRHESAKNQERYDRLFGLVPLNKN